MKEATRRLAGMYFFKLNSENKVYCAATGQCNILNITQFFHACQRLHREFDSVFGAEERTKDRRLSESEVSLKRASVRRKHENIDRKIGIKAEKLQFL